MSLETPRILFVSSVFPAPPTNGIRIPIYHHIRQLQAGGRVAVDLVILATIGSHDCEDERATRREFERVFVIRRGRREVWRAWLGEILFRRPSFHAFSYPQDDPVYKLIQDSEYAAVIASAIDAIDFPLWLEARQLLHCKRKIAFISDCYTSVLHVLSHRDYFRAARIVNRLRAGMKLLRSYYFGSIEHNLLSRFDKVIVQTQADRAWLLRISTGKLALKAVAIPNGVASELFQLSPARQNHNLLFIGKLKYEYGPLIDTILNQIWPGVLAAVPDARLIIVGGAVPERMADKIARVKNLDYIEEVAELKDVYSRASVTVAPVFKGYGFINKVAESMGAGVPVVGDRTAFNGIVELVDGVHGCIAETDAEFVGHIVRLFKNEKLRLNIGIEGQKLARKRFDWVSNARRLEHVLLGERCLCVGSSVKQAVSASILQGVAFKYPDASYSFCPHERYPEYRFQQVSPEPNEVYEAVRQTFAQAGMDSDNFGTANWNPLGGLVKPGQRVFVLCNFVYHQRSGESTLEFFGKCTHGSVVRAVVDYLLIAVGQKGRIRFGNAPLQSCEWEKVIAATGAKTVRDYYSREDCDVDVIDLRMVSRTRSALGYVTADERMDSTVHCKEVDLSLESALNGLSYTNDVGRPKFRVTDYDWRRTTSFQSRAKHKYIIHKEILESDLIFSIPKLKTHEKVGITCGIKGLVGTVGHKDCLAHHRFGTPESGGDEYPYRFSALNWISAFHDYCSELDPMTFQARALLILAKTVRRMVGALRITEAGAWYGNDTCWRMAFDLARIAHFADASGVMQPEQQRRNVVLIDGIVAGEGQGPLSPSPVAAGALVYSDNVPLGDLLACRLMGYKPEHVPLISNAMKEFGPQLDGDNSSTVRIVANGQLVDVRNVTSCIGRPFETPRGWKGYLP